MIWKDTIPELREHSYWQLASHQMIYLALCIFILAITTNIVKLAKFKLCKNVQSLNNLQKTLITIKSEKQMITMKILVILAITKQLQSIVDILIVYNDVFFLSQQYRNNESLLYPDRVIDYTFKPHWCIVS